MENDQLEILGLQELEESGEMMEARTVTVVTSYITKVAVSITAEAVSGELWKSGLSVRC